MAAINKVALLCQLGCAIHISSVGSAATKEVPVVVFGVGTPKASMGWLHVRQLLDGDAGHRGRLAAVVSHSLYLTYTSQSVTPHMTDRELGVVRAQARLLQELVAHRVQIFATGARAAAAGVLRPSQHGASSLLAIMAGRMADREATALQAMDGGATHLLLEAPGAADAAGLRRLRDAASHRGAKVIVNFHLHVAPHITEAMAKWKLYGATGAASLFLEHHDNTPSGSRALETAFRASPAGLVCLAARACSLLRCSCAGATEET